MAAELTFFIPSTIINREIRKPCTVQILLEAEIPANTKKRYYQLKKNSNIRGKKECWKMGSSKQNSCLLVKTDADQACWMVTFPQIPASPHGHLYAILSLMVCSSQCVVFLAMGRAREQRPGQINWGFYLRSCGDSSSMLGKNLSTAATLGSPRPFSVSPHPCSARKPNTPTGSPGWNWMESYFVLSSGPSEEGVDVSMLFMSPQGKDSNPEEQYNWLPKGSPDVPV